MATRPSVSDYMRTLRATVPILVSQIKELAIAEMKPSAIHGGIGAGLFGGAGVIGLIVLKFFLFAAAFGMSFAYYRGGFQHISALALGFLTVAVILTIIVLIMAFIGYVQVRQVKIPEATIAEAKASVSAISHAVEMGSVDAENRGYPAGAEQVVAKTPRMPKW